MDAEMDVNVNARLNIRIDDDTMKTCIFLLREGVEDTEWLLDLCVTTLQKYSAKTGQVVFPQETDGGIIYALFKSYEHGRERFSEWSLPERKWEPDETDTYEGGYADGWNDCLGMIENKSNE